MPENKTFKLLSRLSESEYARFIDFLRSPFFNKRSDIIKLALYLKDFHPHYNSGSASPENIYRNVFGNERYRPQVVKNLLSRMQRLLEAFLTQLGVEKNSALSSTALAYELKRKGSFKASSGLIDKSIAGLSHTESYTPRYLKLYYDYLEVKNDVLTETHINYKERMESLALRNKYLTSFSITAILRIANEYAAFKYVQADAEPAQALSGLLDYFDIEKFIDELKDKEQEEYLLIPLYYYALRSKVDDPQGIYREKLKELTFESFGKLKEMDLIECWSMLFAAYVFSDQSPVQNLSAEIHAIDKFFVDRGIITRDDNGYIRENSYHNIAMQAIYAEDYEWVENFLITYKNELPPEIRENMYNFCMGIYCFTIHDYEKSISFLSMVRVDDIMSNLHIRNTHIKSYYELGYYDEAESAIFAFQNFISQSKSITGQIRKTLPPFIRYSKMLVKSRSSGKAFPGHIYEKVKKGGSFISKKWVVEKMEELLEGK